MTTTAFTTLPSSTYGGLGSEENLSRLSNYGKMTFLIKSI
jgi:hypothetical protein